MNYFLGVTCGSPWGNLTIANQVYRTGSPPLAYTYLTSTVIKCGIGYVFVDRSDSNTINCTDKAIWSSIPDCESKFLGKYLYMKTVK